MHLPPRTYPPTPFQAVAISLWSCAVTMQPPSRELADRMVDRCVPLLHKRQVSLGARLELSVGVGLGVRGVAWFDCYLPLLRLVSWQAAGRVVGGGLRWHALRYLLCFASQAAAPLLPTAGTGLRPALPLQRGLGTGGVRLPHTGALQVRLVSPSCCVLSVSGVGGVQAVLNHGGPHGGAFEVRVVSFTGWWRRW